MYAGEVEVDADSSVGLNFSRALHLRTRSVRCRAVRAVWPSKGYEPPSANPSSGTFAFIISTHVYKTRYLARSTGSCQRILILGVHVEQNCQPSKNNVANDCALIEWLLLLDDDDSI